MKKSIFLTVTAMLWGAFVFGQTGTDDSGATSTKPLNCIENANFPAIGVPHTYEVVISSGSATTTYDGDGLYNWYVTQQPTNLLDETEATGKLIGAKNSYFDVKTDAAFSTYHETEMSNAGNTKKKIELTWKTDALLNETGKQYFLVLKYKENNGTCDAMNMKVMKIEPLNQFKLVIDPVKNVAGDTFTNPLKASVCAAGVDGASYDTGKVTYTYGENTLYYKITASGFVGDWKPRLKVPALSATGGQKYVKAEWLKLGDDATDAKKWHTFSIGTTAAAQELTSNDLATISKPETAGDTPTQDYIVRIVIDNEKYEALTDQILNVATDGTAGGDHDLDGTKTLHDQKDDCSTNETRFFDKDDTTIKARPTVKAISGGFVQRIQQ